MTSCTIVIFHFESLAYLRMCVSQIRKYRRDDIKQTIVIADQSRDEHVRIAVLNDFGDNDDIVIINMPQYGSGYSVDDVIRNYRVDSEFICTIDVDTIPIHKNWLYVPIELIKRTRFAWIGVHAEIESAYSNMGDFFCMCQHFRVARTETYRDLSLNAGFCKNDHRKRLSFTNNEWKGWSDDAIIAHWWEDQYRKNNKLTLAVTHYLGVAPKEGRYGRYTDDLVFHIGFSYNYKMVKNGVDSMGNEFMKLMERMNHLGFTESLLSEMLASLIPLEAPVPRLAWDAETKTCFSPNKELNELIDNLKSE